MVYLLFFSMFFLLLRMNNFSEVNYRGHIRQLYIYTVCYNSRYSLYRDAAKLIIDGTMPVPFLTAKLNYRTNVGPLNVYYKTR